MPACWPRRGASGRASRSCRPPRTPMARRSSPAGRRWAWRISGSSAPRSSRSSCAIGPAPTIPPRPRRSARRTSSTCRAASRRTCWTRSAGSAVGRALAAAHQRGAVLAGCSAGAMVLAGARVRFPGPARCPGRCAGGPGSGSRRARRSSRTTTPGPSRCRALVALQSPRGRSSSGIDEETAVVGRDGAWQVHGRSRVTVWRGRHRERYRAGDTFRF